MFESDTRGEASTIGVALILGLALTSALVVAAVGTLTLGESQQVAETQQTVRAMTELDSRVSLVALEGGTSTTMRLGTRKGRGRVNVTEQGRLRFVLDNGSDSTVLLNTSLGAVVYTNGDQRVAYQGGGVWRRRVGTDGSVMVSPPEVHYRRGTLTLPMINVTGSDRGLSTVSIEKTDTVRIYPQPSKGANWSNPVPAGNRLVMFVQSEYYRAWGAYYERRIGASVTTFPSNETARVVLVSPTSKFKIDSGLISVGTSAPIDMIGSGGAPTFVDSYNSDTGPYPDSSSSNGTVRSPQGVDLGGNTYIKGTVNTSGRIKFSGNNNTIYGDAWHGGLEPKKWDKSGDILGQQAANGTGVDILPIDGTVNKKAEKICSGNGAISDAGGKTLTSGKYCISGDLALNNEQLTIDLRNGNVSLAVEGNIDLNNDATIEVVNVSSGRSAKVWLQGNAIDLNDAAITVEGDTSPAFRLYAGRGTSAKLVSDSTFVGLLFAPTTAAAGGELSMQSASDLYGSAVVGSVSMQSGSAVHYDKALAGFSFDRQAEPAATLSYLYVTVNEVRIEER